MYRARSRHQVSCRLTCRLVQPLNVATMSQSKINANPTVYAVPQVVVVPMVFLWSAL